MWSAEAPPTLTQPLSPPSTLSPTPPPTDQSVITTVRPNKTETTGSEWISMPWVWPRSDRSNFLLDGSLHYNYPVILIQENKRPAVCRSGCRDLMDRRKGRERERRCCRYRRMDMEELGVGGGGGGSRRWRDRGRKSQRNKSPLIRACLYHCAAPMRRGRWEEGTEGQEESRAQIRILIAMIITVCHPMRTFHTCGKCRWVS